MVLVSHTHKFVFLKTSKTAGTSVEMALEPLCTPDGHVPVEKTSAQFFNEGVIGRRMTRPRWPHLLFRRQNRWRHHMTAVELRDVLGAKRWGGYRKISAVRNPFDRAVSQFHWKLRGDPVLEAPFDEKREAFASFIRGPRFKTDRDIVFIGENFIIDDVVRFESIRDDLAEIARQQGWPLSLNHLAHTKSTAKKRGNIPIAEYYTDAADRDQVLKLMSWVFERYGYPTDPRDAMPANPICPPYQRPEAPQGVAK